MPDKMFLERTVLNRKGKTFRGKKGVEDNGIWTLIEIIILLFVLLLIFMAWIGRGSPQQASCSLCENSCPSGFSYAGDCTIGGAACAQCKPSGKSCNGNVAEEWTTGGSCSVSQHVAQCVKRTACPGACSNGACS